MGHPAAALAEEELGVAAEVGAPEPRAVCGGIRDAVGAQVEAAVHVGHGDAEAAGAGDGGELTVEEALCIGQVQGVFA